MTQGAGGTPPPPPPPKAPEPRADGLPMWVTILVVIVLLGLLVYSVVVIGPEGLPLTYFLGGLLGVYGGANELLKARDRQRSDARDDRTDRSGGAS